MPIELNDSGKYTTKEGQSCSGNNFSICHMCARFSSWGGHRIRLKQTKRSKTISIRKVFKSYCYWGPEQIIWHDTNVVWTRQAPCDGRFLSTPEICSVIWSLLQKSPLTQICLVISAVLFGKSQADSNIYLANHKPSQIFLVAKHRQVDFKGCKSHRGCE